MQDLALQVRGVDDVHVDYPDRAHAGRCQIKGGGRTEAAGTEQEHLRLEQPLLAGLTDLGEEEVPLVAVALIGVEGARGHPVAPLVLPLVESPGHGRDVRITELPEGLRCQNRARAAGAVDDDLAVLVGDSPLDLKLEEAPRQVHSAGHGPLGVLVGLSNVEEERLVPNGVGGGGIDFHDLLFRLLQHLSETRHRLLLCISRRLLRS